MVLTPKTSIVAQRRVFSYNLGVAPAKAGPPDISVWTLGQLEASPH